MEVYRLLFLTFFIFLFTLTSSIYSGIVLTPEKPSSAISLLKSYVWKSSEQGGKDPPRAKNPIILIPGDGGSRIQANLTGKEIRPHYFCWIHTSDFFELWLNLELMVPGFIDCWADNMKLTVNASTGRAEPGLGVDTRVSGFGGTDTVEWVDSSHRFPSIYFAPIVEALVSWGYRRGKDVVGVPYDFRRSPQELSDYFIQLRTQIEMTYRWNGEQPVIILAHSMGNLMANHFYQNYVDAAWKNKYIRAHFALAAPWGGAMQTVRLFASGYNLDFYRILLSPLALRDMQRTFTSSSYLLPNAELWRSNETLAVVKGKNYTINDFEQFFTDIGYPMGWKQYSAARDPSVLKPPGVEVHCVYGTNVETPEQFLWDSGKIDKQPDVEWGTGDGTVNQRSLEFCKTWNGRNGGKGVFVSELDGADHMGILTEAKMISLLWTLLYGTKYPGAS